ncbi:MAG: HEAT repeat domain-containing protein, partial [Planctomycetaceae bacterium]|nr:HEAT repeat domain-containing protein [Planctomycetaceae bacterium]
LAEWCKANSLRDQRAEQLLLLLDVEPDHEEARGILGHKLHNGKWLTRDEWYAARGYVPHEGKWVTLQERDLLMKSEGERAAETAWYPKIRQWYNWASGRNPQRMAEARANFDAVTDPDAVPALVNFLGGNNDAQVRLLCVQLLGQMAGPKPVEPLVRKSLYDDEHAVRIAARQAIHEDQYSLALEHYVPELKSDSNTVIQRAAVAIRDMGDMTCVPYLIQALVTHHRWKIEVPSNNTQSFTVGPNGEVGMGNGQTGWLPPEVQGLAATGQLPYGAIILQPNQPRTTRVVTIKGDVKNADVLEALKKLTGQDFGYNKRQWEVWYQTQANT